jgi:hypothetical protein
VSREVVRSAVQHVRALLAQLEDPLAALEHITESADAHIDALAPEFAALDTSPFDGVPTFQTERSPEQVNEPRVARRLLEPTLVSAARAAVSAVSNSSSTRTSGLAEGGAAAAGAQPPARTLPASPRRQVGGNRNNPIARALEDVSTALNANNGEPVAERNRSGQDVIDFRRVFANAAPELAGGESEVAEPIARLGPLANAALSVVRALEEPDARAAAAPSGSEPEREAQGFAQGTVFRPGATNLRSPTGQTPASLRVQSTARSPLQLAEGGEVPNDPSPETQARASRTPFYFDPLAARPALDDTDDVLAERMGQLLREQARRQGVDLT